MMTPDQEELLPVMALTNEIIDAAYSKLPASDQALLARLAAQIEVSVKIRRPGQFIMFGPKNAFEVLVKLGIWLIRTNAQI